MKTWVPTLWRTLNGRIILVHEMALNELNGEGRLADTFKHVSKERLEQDIAVTHHLHRRLRACTPLETEPKMAIRIASAR